MDKDKDKGPRCLDERHLVCPSAVRKLGGEATKHARGN
jgi:hypothetical protein